MEKGWFGLAGALVLFALLFPQAWVHASSAPHAPNAISATAEGPVTKLATIYVGAQAKGVAVNESGNFVYVALLATNRLARVNENSNPLTRHGGSS
jgi:hypothetical protein